MTQYGIWDYVRDEGIKIVDSLEEVAITIEAQPEGIICLIDEIFPQKTSKGAVPAIQKSVFVTRLNGRLYRLTKCKSLSVLFR